MTDQKAKNKGALSSTRASMLRMALAWQEMGKVNHAVDLYSQIAERFPGSSECRSATGRMQSMAQEYEKQGRYRLAMSLYDKLERLS